MPQQTTIKHLQILSIWLLYKRRQKVANGNTDPWILSITQAEKPYFIFFKVSWMAASAIKNKKTN